MLKRGGGGLTESSPPLFSIQRYFENIKQT